MSLEDLVVWGLFGAATGRLLAKDTILREPRNHVLKHVGQLTPRTARHETPDDWAEACRNGIWPLETTPETTVQSHSLWWRAKVCEGISCPSCVSWHTLFWARLFIVGRAALSGKGLIHLFAAWGLSGALLRKAG